MANQYGFYYDISRCIQCRTCEVACKDTRNIEAGPKWRRVIETWNGGFPDVSSTFLSLACMHCERPACIQACPTGAIIKRQEDGIVVVIKEKCNGCGDCLPACPYGIPQFGGDGIMQKCDYCTGIGEEPVCAAHCPAEALQYGIIDEVSRLPITKTAARLNGPTSPSVIIIGAPGATVIEKIFADKA